MILVICSLYSFLSNSALLGPSVYIAIYAEEFKITAEAASGLVSYPNLAYGFGSLVLVPAYLKFGRRPILLLSLLTYIAGLIGSSQATTYSGLMAARVIQGFGSSVCEAIPVQLVNDIFFLHERGKRIGIYTICLCLGSTGPLYAGYMLAGGYSWRLFFYVEFAFGAALLVLAFFFVEETDYKRSRPVPQSPPSSHPDSDNEKSGTAMKHSEAALSPAADENVPPRKSFIQTLKPWGHINYEVPFFMTSIRAFSYYLVPCVLWVVTSYGINIGLGALAFNYTFPLKIVEPPYSWSQTNTGLIAIAYIIGYGLAIPFMPSSDRLAAYLTRKNNGIREAEMRLGVMLPAMLIGPAGLIVYGLTAQRDLHWVGYFAGVAMVDWGAYFYFSFTLAYSVDSYNANLSEMLIAMNLGKQAISFGMGFELLDWVLKDGYATVIAGVFTAVLLVNNMALLIFMFAGKRIRTSFSRSWLARLHRSTIKDPNQTH
ncbi:MFS general substrate transporter [Viridothelium virens]|uniref:MFS general substrate transporter n=1 Tax=Viridothelium virens TaxID=1048519 RepID=A0A6A6HNY5_VIRVR|nr:MFS general substrate transporter [Viridothelium virens]